MKKLIQEFEQVQIKKINAERKAFPKFSAGDTVSVKYKIKEGENTRLQAFQGVVIAKTKGDNHYSATFTVRKISSGVGVERKFMVNSPLLESVELKKQGVVRRAKLYYLRELTGKASRIKEKLDFFDKKDTAEDAKEEVVKEVKAEAVKEKKAEVKAEAVKEDNSAIEKKEESSKIENEDKKDS